MLMQTWAMLVDAYRELCARKLFWITMGISGLVVLAFALVGIDETGVTMLWFTIPLPRFSTQILTPKLFYVSLFRNLGIDWWLGIIASVLALITTAGFFPSLMESGSIEVHLSKPISRVRIFLTRYFTGLLFVALQVGVFTTASFFVLGLRGGAWVPSVFLAIPVVICFFSYLYCVCVLIGVFTRSAMPALILTAIFWFALFILNVSDVTLVGFREGNQDIVESRAMRIERLEQGARRQIMESKRAEGIENYEPTAEEIDAAMPLLKRLREEQEKDQKTLRSLETWTRRIYVIKSVLPKTGETIGLLDRWLLPMDELEEARQRAEEAGLNNRPPRDADEPEAMNPEAIVRELRARPVWWVIGTSLGFEAVVMAIAGWIFVRRDY
ncbi:MAG: hypothetical protein Kow0022_16160 [Phycisphaerales bacterium]